MRRSSGSCPFILPLVRRLGALVGLSVRGLRARPARSVVTALSVAVAVLGLAVFLSLGAGLRRAVQEQVDSIRPQLQVSPGGLLESLAPPPTMPEAVVGQIEAQRLPLNLKFVTPVILRREHHAGLDLTLYGIPAAAGLGRVYPYARVARGRPLWPRDEEKNVVVLGAQAARHFAVGVGERVTLAGGTEVQVIGILAPTETLTDAFVVVPLRTLQNALRVPGLISLAAVELDPNADVLGVARALAERVDAQVYTQQEAREVAARLLKGAALAQWALGGVALLVAFLSVLTTMTVAGFERRAELGVLRALGLRPIEAVGLLVLDGILLAGGGAAAGAFGGWLLSEGIGALTQARLGVRAAVMTPGVLLAVLSVGGLVGALAALPAAWRLSHLSVAQALRSV